jgi:hypothetical protein
MGWYFGFGLEEIYIQERDAYETIHSNQIIKVIQNINIRNSQEYKGIKLKPPTKKLI